MTDQLTDLNRVADKIGGGRKTPIVKSWAYGNRVSEL